MTPEIVLDPDARDAAQRAVALACRDSVVAYATGLHRDLADAAVRAYLDALRLTET